MLGIAQKLEVCLGLRIDADAPRQAHSCRRRYGALLAEIARDGGDQFLDRNRGAPEPETGGTDQLPGARTSQPARVRSRRALVRARHRTNADTLSNRLQITPWASGGRSSPMSASGRSRAEPQGPCASRLWPTMPRSPSWATAAYRPRSGSRCHPGQRATRGAAPPDQAAEESRARAGRSGEGQKPDRGELRLAGQAVVHVSKNRMTKIAIRRTISSRPPTSITAR